ncbi:protein ABCI12, chloroplastic isoform X2 [Rhodamnia argentea]|uniref:Protein ABCI12, chloroplastic isoform X2 n=1 Tax=Rhodamnia argentea TaxID=178133 RepID=A0ABM3H779_9MYRT|nr:protein ABCI12, chloroplastic isoform X2 [Rhodamnia argentea]
MNCMNCAFQTVPIAPLSQTPVFKSTPTRSLKWNRQNPSPLVLLRKRSVSSWRRSFRASSSAENSGGVEKWVNRLPRGVVGADKVLRLIANATASPISQFVAAPTTFLHSVDPRIKLDQLGRVSLLSGILFLMLGFGSDGVPPLVQSRTPPPAMVGLPKVPPSFEGYSYLIMKLGPLRFTRKGLSVASTAACLTFTIFQGASLCLTTTTPEQLASALKWYMLPFSYVGVPVAEIILTLLLSLRFINLVFDEVRNVALGIVSRRISWHKLTMMETIDVFVSYIRRIFKNIFTHAEQISQAMIIRGFRGDSNNHKIYLPSTSSNGIADTVSLMWLMGIVGAAILSDYLIV